MIDDELTTLRRRLEDLDREIERKTVSRTLEPRTGLFQVYDTGSMPTGAPKFYLTHPTTVAGTETEGSTGTPTATSAMIPVLFLGQAPSVGDIVAARQIGGYWIAERGAGGGGSGPPGPGRGTIPGCLCTEIPVILQMTVGLFCEPVFQPCTLAWGPKPAEFADLPLGENCFLSVESFYHDLSQAYYRWYLQCNTGFFGIRRAFLPNEHGGAFLDAILFAWTVGQPGNTCGTPPTRSDFALTNGQGFPGINPQCDVEIRV